MKVNRWSNAALTAALCTAMPAAALAQAGKSAPAAVPASPAAISLAGAPARGPIDSRAVLVTFTDFSNPACGSAAVILQGLVDEFQDGVRIVFKHNLPPNNPDRLLPHEAARAAEEQGAFWPMHDLLLSNQARLSRDDVMGMAAQLRLDVPKFAADLDSGKYRDEIERDRTEAVGLVIRNQPVWYLNGARINGPVTMSDLSRRLHAVLDGK